MEIHRVPLIRQRPLLKPNAPVRQTPLPKAHDRFESSVRFKGKPQYYTVEDIENDPVHQLNRALWDNNMVAFQEKLAEIREEQIDLNEPGLDGHLPFRVAVCMQNLPAIQALYDAGASPNHWDEQGETPLIRAVTAHKKAVKMVKALLAMKADVNQMTKPGNDLPMEYLAPIHIAARKKDPAVLELLIKAGANLNVPDEYLQTPLHEAADRANPLAVKMLLDAKADSTRVNSIGQTPLDIALEHYNDSAYIQDKKSQLKTIELLYKHSKGLDGPRTSSTGHPVKPNPEILQESRSIMEKIKSNYSLWQRLFGI